MEEYGFSGIVISLQFKNNIIREYITCSIDSGDGRFSSLCTIVYALNQMTSRRILWRDLLTFKYNVNGSWIIGGDFNAITSYDEKIGGVPVSDADIEDFQSFITISQLLHIRSIGCYFTWNNKQDVETRIWSRLDRCLVNEDWIHLYTTSQVEYLLPSCSDNSPALLIIEDDDDIEGKGLFKFFNMWVKHPDFISTVKSIWEQNIEGYKMYSFHSKLKKLKHALKELNKKHFMNINEQVLRSKDDLADIQRLLSEDLFNLGLIVREKECIKKYDRLLDCESSYKQKANISWSLERDKGSKFFYSIMKKKRHLNRILTLYTESGTRISDRSGIITKIVDYYKKLLGNSVSTT
ncbi:uncharacterized protein LOC109826511 [Asparagus officinalis]|uniref:uncharacterized protein LOC109826511 n=1 Tax=Asparagus officinalis TaxID=4686 RepID=UPI00098E0BEB|nr:uncharacterized protein LOC109826511 [Asparagus officinalis]